ncbi:MAG: DoxX family protein [Nitrospirales bacterium]|nr:DoxX family protein [Nitrospirales bacterium]
MNRLAQQYASHFMLLGRMMLGVIFLFSGMHKIANPEATQQYMASMGMSATEVFLIGAILVEIGAGLSLLLGFWTQTGTAILFLFLIPTTLIFHTDFSSLTQVLMFLKNIAMMGGLLYIYVCGPGRFSVDIYRGATSERVKEQMEKLSLISHKSR